MTILLLVSFKCTLFFDAWSASLPVGAAFADSALETFAVGAFATPALAGLLWFCEGHHESL